MARTHIDKRSRLVSAAVDLAYQNGFGATSLADIAREAEVPLGNVYYYFKTKDEIGDAIVELRLAQLSPSGSDGTKLDRPRIGFAPASKPSREQGLPGTARLRGRDVLLRAPQGGRLGRPRATENLRSTPGLDRKPVSGTREGERVQTALPCTCFPPCKALRSWLIPFMTRFVATERPSASSLIQSL